MTDPSPSLLPSPPVPADTVFLFDVDNTLLDNDRIHDEIDARLTSLFGAAGATNYWAAFEALRVQLGYADYLGALQKVRDPALNDARLLTLSSVLLDHPFDQRVYPGALDVLAHTRAAGPTVILSDGDIVYQPRKIERSGLWRAVEGRVFIYIHKELTLADLQARCPAAHYVMVDDKLRILAAMKAALGQKLTTVFVRQGHYAFDTEALRGLPAADLTIERIADLLAHDPSTLRGLAGASASPQEAP